MYTELTNEKQQILFVTEKESRKRQKQKLKEQRNKEMEKCIHEKEGFENKHINKV
jgi:hypothetical protein